MSVAKAPKEAIRGSGALTLYSGLGERKYVNRGERQRMARGGRDLPRSRMLFVLTLLWTGARVSECLALTPASFQLASGLVSINTLKRRCSSVREVPLPEDLLAALDREFDLAGSQKFACRVNRRLWGFSRCTAWRLVKQLMARAGVHGLPACPRGLRHGFGVACVQAGIPITLLQRWMGHARLETTAIYTNVCGPEEREIARKFWLMI
jgi:site-specific recombinase XerD